MPFHRDVPTGRNVRGRARSDTPHASLRVRDADGVIALYTADGEPPSQSASMEKESLADHDALDPLRAERDAALEDIEYLEEQLRSLNAYHIHLLETERQRMFDERTRLASELAALREELQRRTYPGGSAGWSSAESPATASNADVGGTR